MKWNPMAEIRREHAPVGDNAVARGDIFRAIYVFISISLYVTAYLIASYTTRKFVCTRCDGTVYVVKFPLYQL